jgi:sulfite exporter TauE/SafE
VVTTPGNAEVGVGGLLMGLFLLYLLFGLECGLWGVCFVALPVSFRSFDAIFLSLIVLVLGIMLVAMGGVRRARARLPSRIV